MMAEDQRDAKDGVIQISAKHMEDLLLSLSPITNESFSSFYTRVQHLELSLTHSPTDKPWESLFVCILQQLLHCTGCDDLEDIVQQAGKYWARLQVKINEIIRSSSSVLNKTITCEEISKTIQNQSKGVQNYIEDFLQFLHDHFNTNVKLSFFEWRALSMTQFRYPDLEKSPKEEHAILVMDPDLNCFRLLTPVLDSGSSIDDYFEELFNQIIQRQEMRPYFIKKFEKLDTPDFQTWVDSQFEILTQVSSVIEFPKLLLPDYDKIVPLSNFPLLAKYFDAVQPSTKEEILQSLKQYYILSVENASKVILETRIAQHKDEYVRRIEKEKELQRQNNQLERDYKTAEERKRKFELELQNYRQNMEADKATKKKQEEIIRQREQYIAKSEEALIQKRCLLAWNCFRKDLMEVKFSYETLQQVSQVHSNSLIPLAELCKDVLKYLPLPSFPNNTERENLLLYIANNDTPETKAEITGILSFLFQPPNIAFNANKNETLEVSGRHLIVSELLKSIAEYQFKELRLAAGLTIYLNADFPQERFHGVSIVMSAPTIEVIDMVTIDTSGNSGDPQIKLPKAANGDYNGRNGTDGEDGAAGESAGHVYLQTSEWKLSRNLTIIANGGHGGVGQDGGDGRDGDSGRDGVDGDSKANWKNQPDPNKYIDRGTKGDRGDKGGDGGRAGLGGEGGNKGVVLTSENFCGKIIANEGCQGEDGRSGSGGRGGPGGYDGTDHGCAWHNYSFMFGEWKYARGELDVREQKVWYGGNGWDLITRRSESEVRSCQACMGGEGSTGKDSSNRASQRNKTSTRNDISQNEVFEMSKAVRNLYNHRDLANLTRETAALKTDQALEAQMSNLRNLKSDEMSVNDEIDAKLERCQKKIDHAVELQTKLKSEMAGTESRQRDVCRHLKKVALEKQRLNSIIDTTEGVANQLKKTFQAQLKFQNQAKQQLQATLSTEFDSTPLEPQATQKVISEDIQINKETWIARYKDIHNLSALPDEVLPVVLASRFANKESARAFEIGLQSVVSSQTLSAKAKGFVEQIFNSFRSDTTPSTVRYFNNYLSADVDIVQQTNAWSGISHNEKGLIFSLDRHYRQKSLEAFLIHIRNSDAFVHPGKVQSFQNNIDDLNKRKFSEHGKLMLDHLSTVMVDFMETWLLRKWLNHYSMSGIPESPENTSDMLRKVRCIYLEAKQYIPKLGLQEVYSNFFRIITSAKPEMQDKDIWHEFVLITTHLKSYSYLTTVTQRKSDLDLIEAALQGSLSNINSKSDVFEKLKILLLVFRHANLLPDQLQKLFSLCDEISCIILQPNEDIFFEFQQVLQSIEDNFQYNHLRPIQSRIRDYIDNIFQGKAKKQLGSVLNDTADLFGTSHYNAVSCTFRLKCLEDFEKFLKQLIDWDDCSSDLEEYETQLTNSLFEEIDAVLKEPYRNISESSYHLTKSILKTGRNAVSSMFTSKTQLIKQEEIPAIIKMIKLLRKQTSWGHIRKSMDTSELLAMNDELETFFQASPHFSNICLIRHEIQQFQLYFKEQSVIRIKNDVAILLQPRKDWMIKFDQKIAGIVEWVKTRIEDSNVIFHQQEILTCIKMHLIKIVDARQVCSHKDFSKPLNISQMLEDLEEILKRDEPTPDKLLANVEERLNQITSFLPGRLCLTFDFPKDPEMGEEELVPKEVDVSDVIKYVSKQLENYTTDPSTLLEVEEILKISCHVLSHCHKIELNVFSDNINETTVPKFAEFHDQVQNLSKGQLQNCLYLAQQLKQFDGLVTAYENSDFRNVFEGLINSRQRRFEDLEQKVDFLLKRTQEDLEEIFDVQLRSGKYILPWTKPLIHYNDSIVKFISSNFEDITSNICETKLFQIYLQSLLKFPYLQDVQVPSSVRTNILQLESCLGCKQFQNVFKTIFQSSTQIDHWGLPILLLIQRLIMVLPEDNCTCQEIHSLAVEINLLAKNMQSAKEQTVLETIMLKLTANSYKCLTKIATERELLDKVHSTVSMVTYRRGIIRQNVFRCELYQKFEAYFQHSPADVSVADFYDKVILPMIDIEIVDTFGLKSPSSTIQEHLINLVNSDAKHFYRRNNEILGLVLLHYNLNKLETDFCKAIANCSHSWKPNMEQKKRLINFIESNNPKETNLKLGENRLVKVFLNDIDVEKKNMNLPFLSPNVLVYLKMLIQSVKPSNLPEITEKIKQILVHCCLSEWESAIKELVQNFCFVRFLNLNVPEDFLEALENVELRVMEKISKEFDTFRGSYKEIPQNAETLELVSKQFDRKSNTNIRLELKVHEMIRFKHFFNRHFHFKAFEDEDIEIFQTFDLLYQRFLIFHVPFEEFNDLFYRLAEIPSKKIIQTVSSSNAFEFMEAILTELVKRNFSALCEKKGNADLSYLFDVGRGLAQWKENGSAKRKLMEILADAILLEVECLSGSTTIDLEKVRRAVECIQDLKISTKLVNDLHQTPLTIWVRKIRQHKLLETFNSKTADAILKFEDKFGLVTTKLLEICNGQPENLIFEFVNNFNSCRWDARLCQLIETENDFTNLSAKCTEEAVKMQNAIIDISEISDLMRENPKNCNIMSYLEHVPDEESEENCYTVPECLMEIDYHKIFERIECGSKIAAEVKKLLVDPDETILQKLLNVRSNLKTAGNYAKQKLTELVLGEEMEGFDSIIYTWDESRIQKWVQLIVSFNDKNDQTKIVTEHLHEVLAVICRGVYLKHEYYPRQTQLISAWLLIQKSFRQKGCLAEIQTGEGKTLIIAMMVIVRVLCGDDVDVITSSPVLAQENLSDVQELYNLFGVTTGTNCDLEAERDEKVRKTRYKSRVIYGDVASFQRDILLTNFFDRGITMGRTTDIIFVDEVDSMLLDKGENILYLSHNIQDLRSLWPIFVEIWNAVHAPDVFRGRPEDVVLVTRFVKHRIQKGDIFFPNSLSKFIKEKLVVWIQNAFLAMNMKENDPYILSDVNKKGPSIVIMDKDTGVEQVNMNWSNGLHQFIQLKHTDRLTSESLKAVFMSNICYFRKFKGKLFGITGTLGSATESELLSKCYDVDFFAVPRFQSRRCIEDEGFVVQDEFTWIKKIQDIVHEKCRQNRAVLIICENVDSVDKIVKELRPMHSQRVTAYKSSFDEEFRKNKETTPLDSGHILAATNIAGRGTDWRTTQAVEKAGGLHVILSYMPGNVRIEEQAFGRTARKGLPGSVQYVVIHTDTEDTTVDALRRTRDENESKRLDNFRIKSIPRIEIEEKLCERFHETLKIVKSKLKVKDNDVQKLHIENLKNKWAMWLDSMSESLKLVHVKGEAPIIEDFEKFKSDMISKAGGVSKFESGPVELIKLGKIYEEKGNFTQANVYFDKVINSEPNYSEVAHYYKAATILKEKSSGIESKRLAIQHLKLSLRLLKKRMSQLMSSSKTLQMTDNIRRQDGMGTMSNRYEKQVENECELYQVHCGKIEEAIGAPITSGLLKTITFVIDDKESTDIFEVLRKNPGVCKNYRLSKKVAFSEDGDLIVNNTTSPWPPLFMYCKSPVVEFLKNCLQDGTRSSRFMEEHAFCGVFEKSVVTRNKFWTFLIQNKVLIHNRVEKMIIIRSSSPEKFKSVMLPESIQDYKRILETILQNNDNDVYNMNLLEDLYLSPEQLSSIEVELAVAGILCLEDIMVADVNTELTEKLQWNPILKSWDGFTPELQQYQDLVEVVIQKYSGKGCKQPVFEDTIRFDEIPLPLDDLTSSKTVWTFLRDARAIKDVRVNFSLDHAQSEKNIKARFSQIKRCLNRDIELQNIFRRYHDIPEIQPNTDHVMEVLAKAVGKIKTLPAIDIFYTPLSDYYKTGAYPPELEDFNDQSFGNLLELTEKTHWFDWRAFLVAMLGLLQIAGGICMLVMSGGALFHWGAFLISEGISDVLFAIQAGLINRNFSWTDYGIHKAMSVSISVVTMGIGAWCGSGVEAARYLGKTAFEILKLAGKDVLKKAGKAVLEFFAELGFDHLLDYLREKIIVSCRTELDSHFKSGNEALFNEMSEVVDQIHAQSYEKGQAERLIDDTFENVFKNEKEGSFGRTIGAKANEISSSVIKILGNCSDIANSKIFSNSSNKHLRRVEKVGKVLSKLTKAAAFLKPLLEMATYAKEILTVLIRSLRATLANLQTQRVGNNGAREDKSTDAIFGTYKQNFFHDITAKIVDFMATTIQSQFLVPAFNYAARCAVKLLNKKIKKNTKNSLRHLHMEKSTILIKQLQFEQKKAVQIRALNKIKGRTTIRDLDPRTFLQGSDFTVSTAANFFGDNAVFYEDNKGKVHFGKPTLSSVIQSFGRGTSVSLVELFVCACYFGFILTVEDTTGELNCEDSILEIAPVSHSGSKKNAKSGFITANLVYLRNDKDEALLKPKYNGEVQELEDESEVSRLGLYQSLIFLKAVMRVEGTALRSERRTMMKDACDVSNIAHTIDNVKSFVQSNLKDFNIVQHLFEKMLQQNNLGDNSKTTMECIQNLSLDGVESIEGGYGNGHIIRKIQNSISMSDSARKNQMEC